MYGSNILSHFFLIGTFLVVLDDTMSMFAQEQLILDLLCNSESKLFTITNAITVTMTVNTATYYSSFGL